MPATAPSAPVRRGVPRFRTDRARAAFLRGYDASYALWPTPIDVLDVPTAYGTTRVTAHGSGDPVVLLHGHGGNGSLWYAQVAALAAGHRVYAVDAIDDPGRSVPTRPLAESGDYIAWLDQVLDGLGIDSAHFVGHSYGGWLATHHAVHSPSRVASLTALDPAGVEKLRIRFLFSGFAGFLRLLRPRGSWRWLADRLANAALIIDWRAFGPVMRAAFTFTPQRGSVRAFTEAELSAVAAPALFVLGGRTTLFHAATARERLERHVPAARVEVLPRAGHGLQFESAEQVNTWILEHLEHVRTERKDTA